MRLAVWICLSLTLNCSAFAAEEKDPATCAYIRAEIRRVEAMARQNSTQYLTDRKRQLEDQSSKLNCSLFDR